MVDVCGLLVAAGTAGWLGIVYDPSALPRSWCVNLNRLFWSGSAKVESGMGAGAANGGALPTTAIGAAYCKGEMCAGVNAGLVAGGLNAEAYLGALTSGSMTCGGVCSGHP